jgi:hypothetical protein
LGGGIVVVARPESSEPIMVETHRTPPAKRTKSATSARLEKRKTASIFNSEGIARSKTVPGCELQASRVTKHDRVLTLLSQRSGATIPEMMDATGWQQHSVRGFLAGTVKKKLGFPLTSSKAEGELRRYRIDTKRSR